MSSKMHTEEGLEQQVQIASAHLVRGKVAKWAAVAASVVAVSIQRRAQVNTVRKPRLFSRTKAAVAVAVTGTIASATVGQQTASADAVWGFRLTNLHPNITTLCVTTDRANVCTGRIPYGTFRVYDVAFNDPASFRCTAKVDIVGTMQGSLNRNEFKECIAGVNGGSKLFAKRPDGSSVWIK